MEKMNDSFKTLRTYEKVTPSELAVVGGGFNKLAYDIGHGLGVVINIYSTLKGTRRGGHYKPRH